MRLLLARHGETVDNVAGVYAGTTDSPLTNHGVLQASRLGTYLASTALEITHIFSSDLQRAVKTAEAVRVAQRNPPAEVQQLVVLREQDFGFYEGKRFFQRAKEGGRSGNETHLEEHRKEPGFKAVESKESMSLRAENFVAGNLLRLLEEMKDVDEAVLVVAHGIILNHLWRAILRRFNPENVSTAQGVLVADRGLSLEYLGGWSNTGYLDMEIKRKFAIATLSAATLPIVESSRATRISPQPVPEPQEDSPTNSPSPKPHRTPNLSASHLLPSNLTLTIKSVNTITHLHNLKKTRGGLGSLKHDSSQTTMDSFFKKRKIG